MSYIISFENKQLGGYGDRVVGLISIKVISKILKKQFYINWKKENIKDIIDYSKYDYDNVINTVKKTKNEDIFNENFRAPFINYLKNTDLNTIINDKNNIFFHCNFEFSKFLFQNKSCNSNYIEIIMNEYKNLYMDILKIKDNTLINNILQDKKNIIGVQIRCGRKDWGDVRNTINPKDKLYDDDDVIRILNNIKNNNEESYVFITSDNKNIKNISENIFNNKLIYYDLEPTHLDNKPNLNTIKKIFIDNYILSQNTTKMYISSYSNFGRIAALSSVHDNIYCNETLQKLNKENLLSKR